MFFSVEDSKPLIVRHSMPERNWADIYSKALSLRQHWTEARRYDTFYTLGKTQYLVNPTELSLPDPTESSSLHAFLKGHFSGLYADLKTALDEIVSDECIWDKRLWPPGFHLFPCSPIHELNVSKPHCDFNYLSIDWNKLGLTGEVKGMFSFTLPISIPNVSEFGMNLWNCTDKQSAQHFSGKTYSVQELSEYLNQYEKQKVLYRIGELLIHPGRFFHEVLPFTNAGPESFRMTLQGHAVFKAGKWFVFW
jgi:hypothetical protein